MEFVQKTESAEILVSYPETRDINYFDTTNKLDDFLLNVKRFAFPYKKCLKLEKYEQNSNLVQFYTFVFTDTNRIRQYGFCRSARNGNHVLCMVSYLPWYNVFIGILNKISNIINDKDVS